MTKDLPKLLDLFTDAALHPAFPAEELTKQKRQAISSLVESKQRPGTLAAKLRGKLLYGTEHPYGAFPTEESLGNLKRDDLVKFHAEYFSPDNATLAVVGDIRADEVVPLVEKAFAEWKVADSNTAGQPTFPQLPPEPKGIAVQLWWTGPAVCNPTSSSARAAWRATTTTRPRSACSTRPWAVDRRGGCSRTCARNTDTPTGHIRVLR